MVTEDVRDPMKDVILHAKKNTTLGHIYHLPRLRSSFVKVNSVVIFLLSSPLFVQFPVHNNAHELSTGEKAPSEVDFIVLFKGILSILLSDEEPAITP